MLRDAGINEKVVKHFETDKDPTLNISEKPIAYQISSPVHSYVILESIYH